MDRLFKYFQNKPEHRFSEDLVSEKEVPLLVDKYPEKAPLDKAKEPLSFEEAVKRKVALLAAKVEDTKRQEAEKKRLRKETLKKELDYALSDWLKSDKRGDLIMYPSNPRDLTYDEKREIAEQVCEKANKVTGKTNFKPAIDDTEIMIYVVL